MSKFVWASSDKESDSEPIEFLELVFASHDMELVYYVGPTHVVTNNDHNGNVFKILYELTVFIFGGIIMSLSK